MARLTRHLAPACSLAAALAMIGCDVGTTVTLAGKSPKPAASASPKASPAASATPDRSTNSATSPSPSSGSPQPRASATATPAPAASGQASSQTTSPTPAASATPTPAPTVKPAPTPTPFAFTSQTPKPFPSQPTFGGKVTIVSGNVYDETGATVEGAVMVMRSLDASVPYVASTTTSAGSYVVNNVPEGANIELVVSKDGWTSRRRVGSFQTQASQPNEVNFGGAGLDGGQAYFISKYPEITAVEPAYDSSNVDVSSVSYRLTLSEALDDVNRRRFEDAIRLFPANTYAAPDNDNSQAGAYYLNLKDRKIMPGQANSDLDRPVDPNPNGYSAGAPNHPGGALNGNGLPWDYSIKKGTLFLDDSTTRATVTWNADNTVATLTFNAPLIADRTNYAKYQVGLVCTSNADRIVDKDNNQLGLNAMGSWTSYPALGYLIQATVRQPDLSVNTPLNGADRWIQTHQAAALFSAAVDTDDPVLVSVAYTKNLGASSRFELTFDAPIAAFNGRSGGHVAAGIRTGEVLRGISFAVSDRAGGTKNVNLKGSGQLIFSPGTASIFGTGSQIEREFSLDPGAGDASVVAYGTAVNTAEGGGQTGKFLLQADPRNPKTLFVYVIGRNSIFSSSMVELKARVEGLADPAGNAITSSDADQNQIQGSL
ncbi:MAG: hypothetical protein JWM80_434 [Cyanobacteria bacterium RYN_339]|nr:hypothetical protein [Cyanobacteria bacterium RYN_339]